MRHLSIQGKFLDMDDEQFFNSIRHLAKGYCAFAEAYHNHHASGFSDWRGSFQMPDVGQNHLVRALADQIGDKKLSKAFDSLTQYLQELGDVDRQITDWLAQSVGLSSVQDKRDKAKLERRLKKIVVGGPAGHPQGPVWKVHPQYQALVKRSKSILVAMRKSEQQIDQRVDELSALSKGL